jgi:outer membrane receptor protein involved in Fe transport
LVALNLDRRVDGGMRMVVFPKRVIQVALFVPLALNGLMGMACAGPLASSPEVVELEAFIVEVSAAETIIPSGKRTVSVFATEQSVLDAPRALSMITEGQLRDKNIQRVEDLDPFISGAYSASIFGNIGVPFLRGELGEVYQNGQRKAFNRNSFPISFNGVESVDAVKGAAPAVFGYGNATGGYLNLTTKRPPVDRVRTTVRYSHGEWNHSRWQVDSGGPIDEVWGFRISYEGMDADSFYRGVENRSQSLFGAIVYQPTDAVEIQFNAEYLDADFTEVPGTNRPTQALIDDGLYITGESISSGGEFFGNTFVPTGTVRIDGSQILLAPGDGAQASVFNAQAILAVKPAGGGRLTNRHYFESVEARKQSSYYFFSYLPESLTYESRLEYEREFETGEIRHQTISGFSYRYESRRSFVDILNEYFNPFDVTGDPERLRYPIDRLFAVLPVPGTGGFAVPGGGYPRGDGTGRLTPSLSATLDSQLNGLALFVQDLMELGPRWSLLVGLRLDRLSITSEDPLPRPGYDPVSDSTRKGLWSGSFSLLHQPDAYQTYYLTLNRAAAVESSSSSGGFGLNGNEIADAVLDNSSDLIEAGAKVGLPGGAVYAAVAAYYQRRNRISPRGGLPDEIEVMGVEWDILYQPGPHLNAGIIGSYSEANYIDGPVSGTPTTQAPFDPSLPNSTFPRPFLGDYRLPGLPRVLVNAFVSYKTESGWGGATSLQWQGEQNLDLEGFVVIPAQSQLDVALFYRTSQFELRFDVRNLTDAFNWRPTSTPFAGADLVTRELPRHYEASLILKF